MHMCICKAQLSVTISLISDSIVGYLFSLFHLFAIDASMWKEAFEKAKRIVGSECEIYAGKSNLEQKRIESDSESSSDVSYSESTDNEDQAKMFKRTEDYDTISQPKDIEKEATEEKESVTNEEKIINEITKLKVKNEGEK